MSRPDLVRDCERCAALCCVATSFTVSEDFAFDKPAGGCRFLTRGSRCAVHRDLVHRGLRGCAIYDCHGAGQRVTRAFAGAPDDGARERAFLALRPVHELLWLLTGAAELCPPGHALRSAIAVQIAALDAIACDEALPDLDLHPHERAARALLRRVGELLRPPARALVVLR